MLPRERRRRATSPGRRSSSTVGSPCSRASVSRGPRSEHRRRARDARADRRRQARGGAVARADRATVRPRARARRATYPCSEGATSARRSSRPRTTPTRTVASARIVSTGSPSSSPGRCSSGPTSTRSLISRWATVATAASASAELAGTAGVTRLGVETVPQIVTTGWLVDVAESRGPGDVITPQDCAGIDPAPGDAVLFHTGWSRHWDDPDTYLSGEPGPGCELAHVARRAPRRAHRMRHVELRPGAPRGSRATVPGTADPQHRPRHLRRREPRSRRTSPPTACAASP